MILASLASAVPSSGPPSGAMALSPWTTWPAASSWPSADRLHRRYRQERASSKDYFLAGKRLPWYVVGSSFVAANISTEHFIGMIGSACIYGIRRGDVRVGQRLHLLVLNLAVHSLPAGLPGVHHSRIPRTPLRHTADFRDHHHRHECHGLPGLAARWRPAWSCTTSSAGTFGTPFSSWAWCPAFGPSTAACRRLPGPIPSWSL